MCLTDQCSVYHRRGQSLPSHHHQPTPRPAWQHRWSRRLPPGHDRRPLCVPRLQTGADQDPGVPRCGEAEPLRGERPAGHDRLAHLPCVRRLARRAAHGHG